MNIDQLKAAAQAGKRAETDYGQSFIRRNCDAALFQDTFTPKVILSLIQKLEEATKWTPASESSPPVDEIVRVYGMAGWAVHNGTIWLGMDSSGNKRPMKWTPEYWMMAQKLPPLPASPEEDAKAARNEEK